MLLSGRKAVNNVFVPGDEKYAIAPFAILRGTDLRSDLLGRVCDLDIARSYCLES